MRSGTPTGRRRHAAFGLGSTLVVTAIGMAVWVGRAPPDETPPASTGAETGVGASETSTTLRLVTTSLPARDVATTIAPVGAASDGAWQFTPVEVELLEGAAYVLGEDVLFMWGGSVDRQPDTRNDGVLVNFDGATVPVPPAPLEPRVGASAVWTGSEFVVFGGRSLSSIRQTPFVDGAAFDPDAGEWRAFPESGLTPGANASAAWTGSHVAVWVSSDEDASSDQRGGQVALLDLESSRWRTLPPPPASLFDATLFADEEGLTLIGGPNMGTTWVATERLVSVRYRFDTGEWSAPSEWRSGHWVDGASAARLGPQAFLVATFDGEIFRVEGSEWSSLNTIDMQCAFGATAVAGGGAAYVSSCSTYRLHEDGQLQQILDDRFIEDWFVRAFLVTADGKLVILGGSTTSGPPGTSTALGLYTPNTDR